jgi:cruciform cutting endonuclease 1
MVAKPRPVTAKALQALLTRIGSASSGTKDVLHARFQRDVTRPRLFALRPEWAARQKKDWGRKLRIISIDMGIKNLAYCDIQVDYPDQDAMKPTIDIMRWDNVNLSDVTRDLRRPLPNPTLSKERKEVDEESDPYSLWVLSEAANNFIQRTILEVRPDIILIERQRWRSAGSAAIQQWTVRVNTLEAMLWAGLEARRTERIVRYPKLKEDEDLNPRNYETYSVDPKRVGQYWLGQLAKAMEEKQGSPLPGIEVGEIEGGKAAGKKIPRSKAEKKAKIAVLQSWLSTEPASTASTTPESAPKIFFNIGLGATTAREALRLPTIAKPRRKKSKATEDGSGIVDDEAFKAKKIKKLDDITDCCLQAAAWVAWESNRLQLWDVWDKKRDSKGVLPEFSEELLKEMIEVAGEK